MCDLQTTNHQEKIAFVTVELVADKILLCTVIKHHCHLFTMCSYFNKFIYCYQ